MKFRRSKQSSTRKKGLLAGAAGLVAVPLTLLGLKKRARSHDTAEDDPTPDGSASA